MTHVRIGIPSYDRMMHVGLCDALLNEVSAGGPAFTVTSKASSLLAFGCNSLWCDALNGRDKITHFMMIHADVIPVGVGFMGKMLSEMEAQEADILSVVLPIKSQDGLTSTALLARDDPLGPRRLHRRRITMQELSQLPDTFDSDDVSRLFNLYFKDVPCLLANTGLMLVDLSGDWVEHAYFEINDTIYKNANGRFVADVEPEDWHFSRLAQKAGARIYATSKIKAQHAGHGLFPNWGAWGTTEHDIPQVSQNGRVEHEVKSKESV